MPRSSTFQFDDPLPYQAAIRAPVVLAIASKGVFRARLTKIDLDRLWLQAASENLPRVSYGESGPERARIVFLADERQGTIRHSGIELSADAIIVDGAGSTRHLRTWGACRWASMSITPNDLAAASQTLIDRELTVSPVMRLVRPDPARMRRLANLHDMARQLAGAAPETLARPEVARALEEELVYAMVSCLADDTEADPRPRLRNHSRIMKLLEEFLDANYARPIYLAEVCAATGASERTLRACCEDYFGMGPIRYLWLRRMNLARQALMLADPVQTTVTEIATAYGFWELGRFSVSYRSLFGESPSVSLSKSLM
jgi:AraC-like DNA-binding protein